jgi:hypothetical protein
MKLASFFAPALQALFASALFAHPQGLSQALFAPVLLGAPPSSSASASAAGEDRAGHGSLGGEERRVVGDRGSHRRRPAAMLLDRRVRAHG